jgi:carbonic anhydrase
MNTVQDLLDRNQAFAATDAKTRVPAIPFIPNQQLYIVTCIDPRVDPAATLGLDLGDAIVARNVGGRVTPAVLRDIGWIRHLHETKTPDADWFELVVIHHTDCGSALLADPALRHSFADRYGYDEDDLAAQAVLEPAKTARADVALLRASPQVPEHVKVHGFAYNLADGLIAHVD